jgi:hypothetical protein
VPRTATEEGSLDEERASGSDMHRPEPCHMTDVSLAHDDRV